MLGLLAAAVILGGKFAWESEWLLYSGISLLMAASVWNSWPLRAIGQVCPACVTQGKTSLSSD